MDKVRAVNALRSLAIITVCCALASLVGCGGSSDKAIVKGKVTYKGAPVTGGTLTLAPASGPPLSVTIKADGTFQTSDIPTGQMGVGIDTDSIMAMPGGSMANPPKDVQMPKKVVIPAKYKDPKTSGLTWDIKSGTNTKDFDLTD